MILSASSVFFFVISILSSLPCLLCIMVPTGKLTPITPAKPTERSLPLRPYQEPAPVIEYSSYNTEPAPLDPSYVPVTYKYLYYLIPNGIVYAPAKIKYPENGSLNKYNYYNIKYPQKYSLSQYYKKPYFNSAFDKKF